MAQPNPLPNQALVESYVARWHASNGRVAAALDILFQTTMPENIDVGEVAVKAAALNGLYATRIGDVMRMARHIVELGIDARLAAGTTDHQLVEDIAKAGIRNKKGTEIRFYSFATKYCSFNQPNLYPIYDSFAAGALNKLNRQAGFAQSTYWTWNQSYPAWCAAIHAFRTYQPWGLGGFSIRDLDRYLWMAAKGL